METKYPNTGWGTGPLANPANYTAAEFRAGVDAGVIFDLRAPEDVEDASYAADVEKLTKLQQELNLPLADVHAIAHVELCADGEWLQAPHDEATNQTNQLYRAFLGHPTFWDDEMKLCRQEQDREERLL